VRLVVGEACTWLVRWPDGARTAIDEQFTSQISATMVANDDGTVVHNTVTGVTFDIPAPFHVADLEWNRGEDAFVSCESDNGLLMVLDLAGNRTPFATITGARMASNGRWYFWVEAGDQQGWVDSTGAWLYQESRYQLTED